MKNKKLVMGSMGAVVVLSILLMAMTWEPKLTVVPVVAVELGDEFPVASAFFVEETDEAIFVTDMSMVDKNELKENTIELSVGRRTYESTLVIVDTIAPTGVVQNKEIWIGETVTISDFLVSTEDLTEVSATYKKEPDLQLPGIHEITVVLKDTSGNATELVSTLTIFEDTEPPVIEGVKDITVFLGNNIAYRTDITVTDNRDDQIDFEVDSSGVNLKALGTYEVLYTAVDQAGNKTTEVAKVIIKEKPVTYVTQEMVDEKADAVIKRIIKPEMTEIQKMRAVFDWTAVNVKYVGYSDKSDWLKGAYQGFTNGTGDCYNYYAVSRALLTRLGVENLSVKRVPAQSRHYWLLVNYEGSWYHFDPTPRSRGYAFECFLRTKPEVDAYTEKIWNKNNNYFNYDTTGLPDVATEPIQ